MTQRALSILPAHPLQCPTHQSERGSQIYIAACGSVRADLSKAVWLLSGVGAAGRGTGETVHDGAECRTGPSVQRIVGTEAAPGTVSGCWLVEGRVCVQYACAAVPVCMALSLV